MGQFHLGLAQQLITAARLPIISSYMKTDPGTQRKKRLYWSVQVLEQRYRRIVPSVGPAGANSHGWSGSKNHDQQPDLYDVANLPSYEDGVGDFVSDGVGIWGAGVEIGWLWLKLRRYVSNCAQHRFTHPWSHNSEYTVLNADLVDLENKMPLRHRYDWARFYDRSPVEIKNDAAYWHSWLRLQFTYHTIHAVLNHPFLYISAAQDDARLTSPNTFWKRCCELGLLHATWIVRFIDMVTEKQMTLTDPFFAHAVAIAATTHLFYSSTVDTRLQIKSTTDLSKCHRFLNGFASISRACRSLVS